MRYDNREQMMQKSELLAPARDLETGIAAVNCGADAVYIGAPKFGARSRAGNSVTDIESLAKYAHKFWAKVYVTVNTLLFDHEIAEVVQLAWQLYDIGVDGLIIQDVGLLECDLPPLPLIASTQMHNYTPERVAFWETVGFQRAILARELTLEQIREIRRQTSTIELEFFVHGALCVSYSGQCYMSYAIGGRSGNRGQCAQPCRRCYSLVDKNGQLLLKDRYLLSLRDLNLSHSLAELIDAGITSFKIEGRLKDKIYVMNTVAFYRRELDRLVSNNKMRRSSSGKSYFDFSSNLDKTFNRGYSDYFLYGRLDSVAAFATPKMTGEVVGTILAVRKDYFELDSIFELNNGDGLCFFDEANKLRGTVVNHVEGNMVWPNKMSGIKNGLKLFRNHDHIFLKKIGKSHVHRKIDVRMVLQETENGFLLTICDEDDVSAAVSIAANKRLADKPQQMAETIKQQLSKCGDSEFFCAEVQTAGQNIYFLTHSMLNEWRRTALDELRSTRAQKRPLRKSMAIPNDAPFPETKLGYSGNVLNEKAAQFYRRRSVEHIEAAAESGLDMTGKKVMTTKYCLKMELGWCPLENKQAEPAEPLYLLDEAGHRFRLHFNCAECVMDIYY